MTDNGHMGSPRERNVNGPNRPSSQLHWNQEPHQRSQTCNQSAPGLEQPMILAIGTYLRPCTVQYKSDRTMTESKL